MRTRRASLCLFFVSTLALILNDFRAMVAAQPPAPDGAWVQPSEGPKVRRSDGVTYVYQNAPEGPFQTVHVEGNEELSLYVAPPRRRRRSEPILVCEGQCRLGIEAGSYRFAVGRRGEPPALLGDEISIAALDTDREHVFRLDFDERSDERAAGWVTLISSIVGGVALCVSGMLVDMSNEGDGTWFVAGIATGAGVMIGGSIAGIYFAGLRDLGIVSRSSSAL